MYKKVNSLTLSSFIYQKMLFLVYKVPKHNLMTSSAATMSENKPVRKKIRMLYKKDLRAFLDVEHRNQFNKYLLTDEVLEKAGITKEQNRYKHKFVNKEVDIILDALGFDDDERNSLYDFLKGIR